MLNLKRSRMQQVFQATTAQPLQPVSALGLWLDPVAALYPKFLFEALDEATVLAPARLRLMQAHGENAIVRMKSPAPEGFCLDALHVRPLGQGGEEQARAVVLCPGANGYYEDSFTAAFVQVMLRPPLRAIVRGCFVDGCASLLLSLPEPCLLLSGFGKMWVTFT